jgi:hypothetical protein
MPVIGNNQLPYPNTSDTPNIPNDMQTLASAVDAAIGGGHRIYSSLTALQAVPLAQCFPGMRATVSGDVVGANDGEYVYSGGSWTNMQGTLVVDFASQNTGSFAGSGSFRLLVHPWEGFIEPDMGGITSTVITTNFAFLIWQDGVKPSSAISLGRLFVLAQAKYEKHITWNPNGNLFIDNIGNGDNLIPVYRRIPIPQGVTFA